MEILVVKTIRSRKMRGAEGPEHQIKKKLKLKSILNFFPFLMNVANANVANAPLREAKVEPKACLIY